MGLLVSLLTGPTPPSAVDPRTIFPVLPRLLCCLPARYRQRLCCGVRFPTQDAPHPSPTAEKRVPNGVGAVPRDEAEEQGYGPPAYALQETAF